MNYEELKDRIMAATGADIDELIEAVRALSVAYGQQKAKAKYLEDTRKTVLYSIIEDRRAEFSEAGEKVTEARLESVARASKEYKDHQRKTYDAEVALVPLEADYFAARNRLDALLEMIRFARSERFHVNSN